MPVIAVGVEERSVRNGRDGKNDSSAGPKRSPRHLLWAPVQNNGRVRQIILIGSREVFEEGKRIPMTGALVTSCPIPHTRATLTWAL